MIRTNYLGCIFDPEQFEDTAQAAAMYLDDFDQHTPFDAIAFTGVSGAALAFPLAIALNKSLLCVRKPDDSTHSPYNVEGDMSARTYVIVDDFIDTGQTLATIQESLSEEAPKALLVGIYLYREVCYSEWPREVDGENIPIISEAI